MKTINNKLLTFLGVVLFLLNTIENSSAQEYSKTAWKKNIILNFGYPLGSNNWEYSHPLYSGSGGLQIIKETGSFESNSIINSQLELLKRYFGLSAGIGIIPAKIKVDKNIDPFNFNSLFLEIEGVFFPLNNLMTKLVPLAKIGAGGIVSYGDLDNTALFVSFGGGLRSFLTKSFGVSLILKGRYFTYDEIPLTESITGDIKFTNFAIHLGILYTF